MNQCRVSHILAGYRVLESESPKCWAWAWALACKKEVYSTVLDIFEGTLGLH